MPRFLLVALVALGTAGCGAAPTAASPTVAPAASDRTASSPTAAPTRTAAPPRAAATATVVRQVAEAEFKWGPMDPNLMVGEGLGLAFQAEQIRGVVQARVTEEGIHVDYDPAALDMTRLRNELRSAGLPIVD